MCAGGEGSYMSGNTSGTPLWLRRLFHQGNPWDRSGTAAAELGFGASVRRAGSVVVDDVHQQRKIEQAVTERQRLDAVAGYFRKLQVNAERGAEAREDDHMRDVVAGWCAWLSDQTMIAIGKMREDLREHGYDRRTIE